MTPEKTFIKIVKAKCKEFNIKLILKNTEGIKLDNGDEVGGYFDHIAMKLVCPMKNKYYLYLLVHEFSHMEQWIEQIDLWKKTERNENTGQSMDKWLEGNKVRNISTTVDNVKWLELDCEKRAVKNIKKYKLPINIPQYIQAANAYILFHNHIKSTRRWCSENSPTESKNKELWSLCPTKFMPASYYHTIPKRIYKKFIKLEI